MNIFSLFKISRLKRLPEVLNQKEKQILGLLAGLMALSGLFLAGNWTWAKSEVVPSPGGEYTEALIGNPIYINPVLAQTNDVDTDLARLVFSGLLKFDKNLGLVNDLAEKLEVSEDKKTYTVSIKANAKWHDETPLTLDDVIFTIKSIQDPAYKSPLYMSLQGVTLEKVDPTTLKLTLKKPFAPFPSLLTFGIIPEHLWSNVPPSNFTLAELNVKPIGSGAWIFSSLTKDKQGSIRSVSLQRNEQFYGQKPILEKLIFKFYPTPEDAVGAAQSKEVAGVSFISKRVLDSLPKNFTAVSLRLPQYTAIFFNQKKNSFIKDVQIRQALALAVNKQDLLEQVLNGEGETIDGPILPGAIGYKADVAKYDFNLETAKSLLEKAGWKEISAEDYISFIKAQKQKEKEAAEAAAKAEAAKLAKANKTVAPVTAAPAGENTETAETIAPEEETIDVGTQKTFRKNKDSILEITLTTVSHSENQRAVEMVKQWWQEIGVKVNLNILDPSKIQKDIIKARDFEALLYGEILGYDPDPFPFWHSSQIDDPGLNLSQFQDKEADRLMLEARQTADVKLRELNYQKFQDILIKQLPAIFLYSPTYTYLTDKRMKGFDVTQITAPADRFNNVSDWYLRTKRIFHLFGKE